LPESTFDTLRETLETHGVPAAFDHLIAKLETDRELPQLFEALLMKKRHELGLPLEGTESIKDIPAEHQDEVESFYVEVCRTVGGLFLDGGNIIGAWPYFRAIDEPQRVADAIAAWSPPGDEDQSDSEGGDSEGGDSEGGDSEGGDSEGGDSEGDDYDQLDQIIDIAFHQGAHPTCGYELILSNYGTCRAVTTIEHQFPYAGDVKESCARLLITHLYGELRDSLQADVERSDDKVPENSDVAKLIEGRSWLFENLGYHVDISHLQSCVRVAASVNDAEVIGRAVEMCDYGRQLARDFQAQERPPFDDFYNDYRIFLRALIDEGVDGAVRYFTSKADRNGPDEDGNHFCGEVLVHLLHRVGRSQDAIDAYLKYLESAPGPLSICPSLVEICEKAGDYSRLLDLSKKKGDLLQYTLGLTKSATSST